MSKTSKNSVLTVDGSIFFSLLMFCPAESLYSYNLRLSNQCNISKMESIHACCSSVAFEKTKSKLGRGL